VTPVEATPGPAGPEPVAARAAHWSSVGLLILGVGATIVFASSFLMPVVLAFLLSLTFSPIRRALARRKVPPVLTATFLILGLVGLTGAAVMGLSTPLQTYASDAPNIMQNVEWKLRDINSAFERVARATEEVEKLAAGGGTTPEAEEPERVVVEGPSLLSRIAANTPYMLAQFVLMLALLFFLIASGDMFYEKIVQASPTFRDKRRALQIAYDIERKISRYFLTITIINAGLGIAVGTALYIVGMPNPVLFGAMAFVLNYIPFLGAVAGAVITAAIGIVTFDQVGTAALAAGLYITLTTIEGQLITPYAVGRSLKLNPVFVFLAVAFWGWAWSVIGMIIAVPVLITLRAFAEHIPALTGVGIFLSGRDPDPPEESPPQAAQPTPREAA
jgi:predicted PurR-regulated permease PerM